MRTKNRPEYLKRSLTSIANQTYKDYEVLIINNGDTLRERDVKTWATLPSFAIIDASEAQHRNVCINYGLREAQGEYITLLDDDDTWEPTFLEKCVNYLSNLPYNSTVEGVCCWSDMIKETDALAEIDRTKFCVGYKGMIDLARMLQGNHFTTNSFMYRADCVARHDLKYDSTLPVLADWKFNLEFLMHYDIGIIPEVLAHYHKRLMVSNSDTDNSPINNNHGGHYFHTTQVKNELLRRKYK